MSLLRDMFRTPAVATLSEWLKHLHSDECKELHELEALALKDPDNLEYKIFALMQHVFNRPSLRAEWKWDLYDDRGKIDIFLRESKATQSRWLRGSKIDDANDPTYAQIPEGDEEVFRSYWNKHKRDLLQRRIGALVFNWMLLFNRL